MRKDSRYTDLQTNNKGCSKIHGKNHTQNVKGKCKVVSAYELPLFQRLPVAPGATPKINPFNHHSSPIKPESLVIKSIKWFM